MLKGAVASILIAIALFLIYDLSTSYQAPCVPVPERAAASGAPLQSPVQPDASTEAQTAVAPPAAATRQFCGFDHSMTMRATRATVAFLDQRQGAVVTGVALALLVVASIIAFFTGEIAAATRRSVDYARRQAENLPRLERGYVFVSQVDKSTWVSADNERIMVAVDVRNYGRTPTILIESYGEFLSAPPDVRPAKYPFADANRQTHQIVLAPGAPALRLDDRFFGRFVEPAYFLGYVKYRDVFRATHVSCWCLKSKRVGEGWVWEPAGVAGWDDYD